MLKKFVSLFVVLLSLASTSSAIATSHGKSLRNLNSNDIMFAHQQAIEMSKYALKNSTNMEIKRIASAISASQGGEISQMKFWLKATKSSATMGHSMDMNGMISESQMRTLSALKGEKFDEAFLRAMVEHHRGALEMITLLKGTKNSEARKLAANINRVQKAEISVMKKLLVKLA
jgi:uncharacterized protein (DUF305 family)